MSTQRQSLDARLSAVRERIDIADVIGRVVKLGRGAKPRGKCPFHGSKSDSFAVDPGRGRARCWGCQWSGDAIAFVRDYFGLSFVEALARLESEHQLDGLAAAPVRRARQVQARPEAPVVSSLAMGRHIWRIAVQDPDRLRVYLRARGVPEAVLTEARLTDLRFAGLAPIHAWKEGSAPESVPQAPAMVALVRRPPEWRAIGVHVTYLSPDLTGKMVRERRDGDLFPARKMLGPVGGGGVLLGAIAPAAALFVGEGIETVLSGMGLLGAGEGACGLAALSLDTLQGGARLVRGALPLFDPEPDPERLGLAFAHDGPVTGLIDADMAPLRGPIDRVTKLPRGMAVIERRGGPVVHRAISSVERAELCGALFVKSWRAHGCRVSARRPRMGQDFNDAVRGEGM